PCLLPVRRGDAGLRLAPGARTWGRVPPAVPPAPRAEAPSVRAMVEKPAPPLPPESQVTLEELTRAFAALVPPERPPARLANYQHDLLKLHRQTDALAARAAVPSEVAAGLRTVLRYYDAAQAAWAAPEAERRLGPRPPRAPSLRAPTQLTAPFRSHARHVEGACGPGKGDFPELAPGHRPALELRPSAGAAMPETFPTSPRAPSSIRLGAILLALAAIVLASRTTITSLAWIGRVFPGFVLLDNRVVASVGVAHWPGTAVPGLYQSEVVAVDGEEVASTPEIYARVAARRPGTP